MTRGEPSVRNMPGLNRRALEQAAAIHDMHARHVPWDMIRAAHGCSDDRIRAVLAQPAPNLAALDDDTDAPHPPRPARGPRLRTQSMSIPELLDYCEKSNNPSTARLAKHIRGDADLLYRVTAEDERREITAEALVASDQRRAALEAENAARHRRRSDGVSA